MMGRSTLDIDSAVSTQELPAIPDADDIFLTVQRSTKVVGKFTMNCSPNQKLSSSRNCQTYAR